MTISARFSTPRFIERNKTMTLDMPVYADASLASVASGTVTIYRPDRTKLVDAAAVTVTNGIPTYELAAATTADEDLGEDWQEEWKITIASGAVETIRRDAALVLRSLYPVVTTADLYRRHPDLDAVRSSRVSSFQPYLDDAWDSVQLRLMEQGNRPYLTLNPWSLREAHLFLSLSLIFRDGAALLGGQGGRASELAEFYTKAHEDAWGRLKLDYDISHTNDPAAAEHGASAVPIVYLNHPPQRTWSWR